MLTGPVLAAALVLCIAGVLKFRRPAGTVRAVRAAGLGFGTVVVRALGAVEFVIGIIVIGWAPLPAVAALAVCYAGFAVFALRLLAAQGTRASCGCFGEAESPVHAVHVGLNVAVAAIAVAATARWHPASVADAPILVTVAAIVLAGTLIMALTLLPSLLIEADRVLVPTEG